MRVAVVGAGTAGPAAALNLARRIPGASVRLFERASQPSAVGAGIGIQPIGMTALNKLGVLEDVLDHGARVDGIKTHAIWSDGGRRWPVLDVEYRRLDERLFGLGLHRGVLFSLLLNACEAEPAISFEFGVDIASLEQTADTVTLRDVSGKSLESYDLVVLADGQRSHLRHELGLKPPRQYDYGALFALLPDRDQVFSDTLRQIHAGPGCHVTLGFLPTARAWGDASNTLHSTLYFNLRHDEYDGWLAAGLQPWKDTVSRLMPEAADLVQDLSPEQIAHAEYHDGTASTFNVGRVVVLGDAASSKSPQLGQGANVSLIDAEKLVDCLAARPDSVPEALADYTRARWAHTMFYAVQSKLLTPIFASRSRTIQLLRNLLFYPACHTPVVSRFAHTVLVGAQRPSLSPWSLLPEDEWLGFLNHDKS